VSECVLLGMGSAHAGAFPGKNSLYSIPHTLYNRCMVLANANMWPSTDQRAMQPATFRHNHLVSQPSAPCHQPPALLGDNKITLNKQHIHPATLLDNRMRVLEEYDDAGTPARQAYFVWGTYVDELLLVNDDADDDADYYACRDHLYSVHVLYNPTTGIAERYDYDAYGQPTIYTADGGDSDWWDGDEDPNNESLINNAYTFTGRRLDTLDSGDLVIMYYRARYYSTNTGRFISRDPLEYVDGMNLYDYVAGHPTRFTDPSGNMGLDIPQITGMCYQYSADVSGFLIRNWKKTILDKEFGMGKVTEDATKEAVEEILNEAHTEEGADLDGEILRLPITGKKECVKPCRCRFRAQIQISNFTIISKHVTRWMDLGWSKKSSTIKPYPFKKADVIIDFDLDLTISLSGFVGVCTMPRPGESRS